MRKFLFFLIALIIVASAAVIIFSMKVSNQLTPQKPAVLQNVQVYPICFLLEEDIKYNPMFPYGNEMEVFTIESTETVFSPDHQVSLYLDKENVGQLSYEILDPLTNEIVKTQEIKEKEKESYDSGIKLTISLPTLKQDKKYVLKLTLQNGSQNVYYYQAFYVGENLQSALLKAVLKAHKTMFDGDNGYKEYLQGNGAGGSFYEADQNSSADVLQWKTRNSLVKMNEPIPSITSFNPITKEFNVQLKFTVANRVDYDFEYWDFTEHYKGARNEKIQLTAYKRQGNRKNEPYYDEDIFKWVLDEGYDQQEEQVIYSKNGQYAALVYRNEIYLLDKTYNTLAKVFGFDTLDSDYLMDEDNKHGLKLLELSDKGDLQYLVYGYMAGGQLAGNNGILLSHYSQQKVTNENKVFVKLPFSYDALDYYIKNTSYYNETYKLFYWEMKDSLYTLNVKAKTLVGTNLNSGYITHTKESAFYSVDTLSKENSAIELTDLSGKSLQNNLILYENQHVRPLGTLNGKLIVGTYKLENTFEYLNGQVFYPYDAIKILNYDGTLVKEIVPEANTFFQDVLLDEEEGHISANTYGFNRNISGSPNMSKVSYQRISESILYEFESMKPVDTTKLLTSEDHMGTHRMLIDFKSISLMEDAVPTAKEDLNQKVAVVDEKAAPVHTLYEIYESGKLVGITSRMDVALGKLNKSTQGQIYEENREGHRKLVYDSAVVPSQVMWQVDTQAQRPELIRGCEVTALAMFLSYYTGESVDKIELAGQLRRDETPETVVDGMIYFGDMHKGFVGSLEDRTKPGLGVYVEPLYDLAKNYVDEVHNITGADFEQVLNFVGSGSPVLVITTGNFNAVPQSLIQNWVTASGYMEITFKEHSVLIVGYDENYVYFNDPNTGKLNKQTIGAFKAGWENQGSQALVAVK